MYSIAYCSKSDSNTSQDRALCAVKEGQAFVVLADGAGGFGGGDEVAEAIVEFSGKCFVSGELTETTECAETLLSLDRSLRAKGDLGESTAAVVIADRGVLFGASVGDSGVLLIDRSHVIDLTSDQNRKPRIGTGRARPVSFGPVPFEGIVMIASDGVLDYLDKTALLGIIHREEFLSVPEKVIEHIRHTHRSLPDDASVALIRATTGN